MKIRDIFRRKPVLWTPEVPSDASWSPVRAFTDGQSQGPIQAPRRNSDLPVQPGHVNRAGRRLYVRLNQTRQFKINVVGFGRWRRPGARLAAKAYGSNAANTAIDPVPLLDRRDDRPRRIYNDKQNRRAGLRPGWRRPVQ